MSFSKIVVSGVVAVALFGATAVSAQSYSYYPSYTNSYVGGCGTIATTLSYGSTGPQVRTLQNFLVAQNYPGGGSWMVTGYYGQATAAAVRIFQQQHGLPQTGSVDSMTLAAINGCSGAGYGLPGLGGSGYTTPYNFTTYPYSNYTNTNPYTYTYPYNYNNGFNYNNTYNNGYNCGTYPYYVPCTNYNYGSTPTLTSLSVTSALPGQTVTAYGTGFDPINNTVYVGGTTLSNIPSNGSSLIFTVPSNVANVVSVSVGNSHGISNALTLSLLGNQIVCLPGQGGTYPYNTGNCVNNGIPTISYLSPQQGGVGTSVTIFGSGFSSTGNAVHFGNGVIANITSVDGRTLSFTVPSTLSGYGYQPVGLGTYNVSVSNSAGITSNSTPFTITALGGSGAPTITSVNGPTSLAVGTTGNWSLTIQNSGGSYVTTSVNWGDTGNGYVNMAAPQTTYAQGASTLSFTHAYVASGTYTITFTVANQNGQQNVATASVNVSGSGSTSGTQQVTIINMSFNPGQITVHAGTTLVWTNQDSMAHTVTSTSGLFASGTLNPGASYSHTFTQTGTFSYYCQIHPFMQGTVTVIP